MLAIALNLSMLARWRAVTGTAGRVFTKQIKWPVLEVYSVNCPTSPVGRIPMSFHGND